MRFLLICMIYSMSETLILDCLTAAIEESRRRKKLRLCHFIILFVLAPLKLVLDGNKLAKGFFPLVILMILILSLKKIAGISNTQIAKVLCINIVVSLGGDVIATFLFSDLSQEITYPFWKSSGMVVIVILSNSLQVLAAFLIAEVRRIVRKKSGKEKSDMEQLTWLIILYQFIILGTCFFYEIDKYKNLDVTFLLVGQQICFSIAVIYLILGSFRDNDVKWLQTRLETLELENRSVYQYYQDLEEYERKLQRLRHDFNNFMYAACAMANKGDFKMAEEIIKEMEKLIGTDAENTKIHDSAE